MATLTFRGPSDEQLAYNRNDKRGVLLSVLGPLIAVLIENAIIFALGAAQNDEAFRSVALAPPGWFVGLVWTVIYPMWGYARWRAVQDGHTAALRSWWIVALILWGLAYPIATLGFDVVIGAWLNVASLLLALTTFARVQPKSPAAAPWLIPSIVWMAFASYLGFAALANI
jgi:tryptophan-rich sensory protein